MIPQTTELSQIQAAFIDKDNRIEELMRQINSAQSLLNSLKDTMNSLVGDGKITIQTYTGSNVGDFTVNQKEDKTITLPQQATVNNGTLTIQKNGTSVGTFTANQSENTTANISVPTKTSEITNDSNFVSDANYVHTDNNFTNADKAEIWKINNSLQFTYVVDSDQALADWANNASGNDYTSVLIRGQRTLSGLSIDLSATGTKIIIGEPKSSINATYNGGTRSVFGYSSLPQTDDYFICGLSITVNFSNVGGGGAAYVLMRCRNIYNSFITCNGNTGGHCFRSCENIYSCSSVATAASNYDNNNACGFRDCRNLFNCKGSAAATKKADAYGYYGCINVSNCSGIAGTTENNKKSCGFEQCLSVRYCQGSGVTAAYEASYFSPTADPTYACANTLNGGWNT